MFTIADDISYFSVILITITIGFTFSFHQLRVYDTLNECFLQVFAMMMGGFDLDDFRGTGEDQTGFLSKVLFIAYMVIVTIIMLNSLIAIMRYEWLLW